MYRLGLFIVLLANATGYPASNWPTSQFHVQDQTGSYHYGYSSPHHAKVETRANGITKGDYSYIDANGILQTASYTADDLNGFRIRASNLPQPIENSLIPQRETTIPEIGLSSKRQKHLADYERFENIIDDKVNSEIENRENPFLLSSSEVAASVKVPTPYLSSNAKVSSSSILNYPMANLQSTSGGHTTYVPIVPWRLTHSALHHTQDSLGQYDYSYVGDTSAKTESRSLDGTTRGAYSYIDANGLLQQVHYIADHNGFRVLATNLPQAE